MLGQLPVLALEKIVKNLDVKSRANLVKSAQENEVLTSKLEVFELSSPCPFCVLERLLTPDRIISWRKMPNISETQIVEIEEKLLNFVLCNEVKIIDEKCWQKIVPTDEIDGFWITDDREILRYDDLTTSGLLVDFFNEFSRTFTHDTNENFEDHIFEHFAKCQDEHIGQIKSKEKMYKVIDNLSKDEHPFVVPEFYETNLNEDISTFLVRIVAAKYLAVEPFFQIGLDQSEHNLEVTKSLLEQCYKLCLNIRLLSDIDIDVRYFINNVRILRLILK